MSDFVQLNHFGSFFGLAEAVINPPLDIYFRNWGAARTDRATGIHKDLKMACLAIKDAKGENTLYLITADLGWWINPEDELTIRHEILNHYQLGEENLLFCLSHTHSGPSICSTDIGKRGGQYVLPYLEFIKNQAIQLIGKCNASLQPGILEWEYGKCSLARNRDFLPEIPNNKGQYLVGFNPKMEKADDTLLLGSVYVANNGLLCTIVNYGCHPTTLAHENTLISPDFVGEMREVVERETHAPCLFLQGASGDLAPKVQYVSNTAIADAHGRQLAYATLATMEGKPKVGNDYQFMGILDSGAPLAIWQHVPAKSNMELKTILLKIEIPLKRDQSIEQIEQQWTGCKDPALKERLWRKLNKRRFIGEGATTNVKVWIWKLGDGYVVGQPNEAYASFQMEIRKAFPDLKIAVINIANGYIGYMPPYDYYDKNLYSVNITPYGKGALELMTTRVIAAIKNL